MSQLLTTKMRQSSYYHLGKKGYLQIDFLFAITAFLIFFYTIFLLYEQNYNGLENSIQLDYLQIASRDICYMITSFSGIPNNWETDTSTIQSLGLLQIDRELLDLDKINALTNQSNYFTVLDSLNVSSFVFINISSTQNSSSFVFGSRPSELSTKGTYTCYASIWNQNHLARVFVEVWR